MSTNQRKAKVTDETVKESERLKRLWDTKEKRPSQEVFAERFGIGSQSALTQFLNGRTPISLKAAMGFAQGLGCEISDFSTRLAIQAGKIAESVPVDEDYADVKRINVSLSAGHGITPEIEEVVGSLKFTREFLRSCNIDPKNARIVDVVGHSMYPTIRDGSVLLVDTKSIQPIEGKIFALSHPTDGLIVKRLIIKDGFWVASSDNRDFDDIKINNGEPVETIGQAKWMGTKL